MRFSTGWSRPGEKGRQMITLTMTATASFLIETSCQAR